MLQEIVIATHNESKRREMEQMMHFFPLAQSMQSLETSKPLVEESGSTFKENATLKAVYAAHAVDKVVIADDSGLVIDALDGELGVQSARFAQKHLSFERACEVILEMMSKKIKRKAHFVCALAIAFPNGKCFSVEKSLHGYISNAISGTSGMGYDPIFIPNGFFRTIASMSSDMKNKISHRAKAFGHISSIINNQKNKERKLL